MAESPVRKVLIYRLGSLGDTVVALPCFHLIERTFPGAERVLLTNFPVHAKAPENTLTFPYNQRWAMTFWSQLFNPDTRFAPDSDRSPEWNRGAYLVEALAHCGECHTPRNLAFALDNRKNSRRCAVAPARSMICRDVIPATCELCPA